MRFHFLVFVFIYLECLCLPFCLGVSEYVVTDDKDTTDVSKDTFESSNKGWWSSDGVSGGNGLVHENPPSCLDPANIPIPPSIDPRFFVGRRYFYYSAGSSFGYQELARKLLGRNVFNKHELDEMCPGMSIGADPVLFNGYGVQFALHCIFSLPYLGQCTVSTDVEEYDEQFGVKPELGYKTIEAHLVATDNRNFAMFYLCMDGTKGDYQLLTTRPFISPDVMTEFLSMKNRLRFNRSQPLMLVCHPPKKNKPYPPPFQSYPTFGNQSLGWSQSPSHNNGWSQSPSHSNGWSS